MLNKNTKFSALRGLAIAICSVGVAQGAVTLSIYESGGRTHFEFDGGTLNLSPSQVSVPMTSSSVANQVSAVGATGAVGIGSLSSGASGSFTAFTTAVPTTSIGTWVGSNNLNAANATYEGGTWGLMAGDGDNLTVSNNAAVFSFFFTPTTVIDAHQSIAGDLVTNGFVVGDTRTLTMGEANDTYTINVVATPAPEPSSTLLAALGCGFLAFRRKRK